MKPLQIGLLVLAGAMGGAVLTKLAQKPHSVAPAQQVAEQAPAPVASPAVTAPPVSQPQALSAESPTESRSSAVMKPAPTKAAASKPVRRVAPPANPRPTEPVTVAQTAPPASAPSATIAGPVKEMPPPPVTPARPEPENVTPLPPPDPNKVTLNAGTLIPVRLVDGLSSERNVPGDMFVATLDHELVVDGFVIAERGARVEGRIVSSDRGGKVRGVAALAVELTRIRTSDGQNVAIQTDSFERHAQQTHGQDAAKVGVGAAIGAAIGAIAGGGKGAAVGAGAGGAAGAGDVLLTRGKPATLPSETRINFRLKAPVTLTERLRG